MRLDRKAEGDTRAVSEASARSKVIRFSFYRNHYLLAPLVCWNEILVHKVLESGRGVHDLPDLLVLPHKKASVGIGMGVADVDKNALESLDGKKPRELAPVRLRPSAVTELRGYGVHIHVICACRDGSASVYLLPSNDLLLHRGVKAPVCVLKGVTDADAVYEKPANGIVRALGDALEKEFHCAYQASFHAAGYWSGFHTVLSIWQM